MSKQSSINNYIQDNTDIYFTKTKNIVKQNGDKKVVYAVFLRRDILYSCKLAIDFIHTYSKENDIEIKIYENYKEGDKVPAEKPLFFIEGSLIALSELETIILQKVGLPCVCAYNAYHIAKALPNITFVSMLARHCANPDMANMAEYGVSVGSKSAHNLHNAKGFLGSSINSSIDFFNSKEAFGTMPHSLIGYAGSTLKAAQMFYEQYPNSNITVLVDYFGKEVSDSLEVCKHFASIINEDSLSLRIDTHKNRYLEGLDKSKSLAMVKKYHPNFDPSNYTQNELEHIIGKGVSVAAVLQLKDQLLINNFNKVKIVVSSGFSLEKCNIMAHFNPPIDIIGTGSILPKVWGEVFVTADIISYNEKLQVKSGRESLITEWQNCLDTNRN